MQQITNKRDLKLNAMMKSRRNTLHHKIMKIQQSVLEVEDRSPAFGVHCIPDVTLVVSWRHTCRANDVRLCHDGREGDLAAQGLLNDLLLAVEDFAAIEIAASQFLLGKDLPNQSQDQSYPVLCSCVAVHILLGKTISICAMMAMKAILLHRGSLTIFSMPLKTSPP